MNTQGTKRCTYLPEKIPRVHADFHELSHFRKALLPSIKKVWHEFFIANKYKMKLSWQTVSSHSNLTSKRCTI